MNSRHVKQGGLACRDESRRDKPLGSRMVSLMPKPEIIETGLRNIYTDKDDIHTQQSP
jgi:hypothetical protein